CATIKTKMQKFKFPTQIVVVLNHLSQMDNLKGSSNITSSAPPCMQGITLIKVQNRTFRIPTSTLPKDYNCTTTSGNVFNHSILSSTSITILLIIGKLTD